MIRRTRLHLLLAALLAGSVAPATAATIYPVEVNTSAIAGMGTFTLAFQLVDGSGTGDGNNSAMVTMIDLGAGGALAGVPTTLGDATGDAISGITLTDTQFLNAFLQPFLPGSVLRFTVTLTENVDAGVPDAFNFSILDPLGLELPTTGPGDQLVTITLSDPQVIELFRTDLGRTPIDLQPTLVPEPAGVALVGGGLILLGALRRNRR